MTRNLTVQQDMSSSLVIGHKLHAGNNTAGEKVIIDRLELHLGQASGVSLTLGRVHALSTVRRRRPIYLLPQQPPLAINRTAELETLRQSLIARHVVDLHGPDGAGKSTLAAALVHSLDLNHFPDGAIFVTGRIRYEDLLQALFDIFYESDIPVKITMEQTPTYLRSLRVLVVLDDVDLGPKQIDPILDALHEAAVLIVGQERTALGRGRALPLKSLSHQDAVALFKARRKSSPDEFPVIDQICTLLNDMPLPISCVAAHAGQSKQTLTKLLTNLQGCKPWAGPGGDPSVGPSLEQIVPDLIAVQRQILTLVAASAGPGISSETLRKLTNLSATDFQEHVEHLQELGLLHAIPPVKSIFTSTSRGRSSLRLSLTSAYYKTVGSWLVDDAVRSGVADYFATRLSRGERIPGDELPGLLGAIEDSARNGWHDQLQPMVRAADRSLAQLRWWAEWQHVLDLTRRSGQAVGDRALEAWATHQLGSVLGALGVFERAFRLLRTALSMRQALGDQVGADVSARNLEVLEYLLPAEIMEPTPASAVSREEAGEPASAVQAEEAPVSPASEAGRARRLRFRLVLLVALAVVAIGALALRFVTGAGEGQDETLGLHVSWEFGDAWNALDNKTWTQQIRIVVEDGSGDYRYFVNDEPAGEMFEVSLPLCDGARGTIQVETDSGQKAEVEYEFDSPYCR